MKTSHAVRLVLTLIASGFVLALIPPNARADAAGVLPDVPVISIKATTPETREPFCDPAICDAAPPPPGIFTVSRTGGDFSRELTVFLGYEGSAVNGVDYTKLPEMVQFPAGAESVELYVEAAFDQLPEGDEVVVARLQPDPSVGPIERYRLDPLQSAARMLIRDNEAPIEPVVSIVATSPIAEETSFPYRRIAFRGVFTISRTGPTNDSLRVFVHYSGTATPGVDFPALPWLVTIPAGASQVELEVVPTMDGTVEPIETLDATLSECPPLTDPPMGIPCYAVNIDPAHATARVFLRDDGITTSTLELTAPHDGDSFPPGRAIRLAATAIDLDGAITYVEFYDGETKVGESAIFFIRAPDPGTPIYHEFNWEGAAPGKHELTVRAVSSSGEKLESPRVTILVGEGLPLISIKATTPETREPFCDPAICDAAPPPPGIFTVSRKGGDSSRELTVFLSYEGSAANGVDYAKLPEVVQFPAGAESVELYVEATFDQLLEGDEIVVARLQPDPSVGPIERYRLDPLQSAARMLIRDNEAPIEPVVSIVATSPIAEETSFPYRRIAFRGVFTISRTGPTNDSLRVFVHYSGTATPGVDFPALPWLVTIPAGASQVELEVVPTMDGTVEPIETLDATLSECPPLTDPPMGIPCYAVNIDPAHATARVFLRDDGITTSTLELTAPHYGDSFPPGRAIHLAATAIDLDGAITYVEFYDGETKVGESAIFFIRAPDPGTPIYHEFNWEGAAPGKHELTVRAVSSSGEKVTSPPVTILVGEGLPVVSIEATVPETTEPSPTTRIRPGVFTLRRTGDASAPLRVWVHFAGTATPDLDYVALPNVVEFPAGASSVELIVAPLDDKLSESDETVVAELGASPLAVIPNYDVDPARRRAVVIIHDNGTALPVVRIRATRPITSEPCPVCLVAPGVFTVSRTGDTGAPLGVWYRLGGTAKNGEDYERLSGYVTIPEGKESVEILVLGKMDNIPEGDETVVATLTIPDIVIAIYPPPPPPYEIDPANASATVTIRDYPPTPSIPTVTIVATDPFAREGANPAGVRNNAAFTVTRTGETTDALEVRFELGGTAQAGVDYRVTESPLIIPAGQRRAQIIVSPIDDSLVEGIETVVVGLEADLTSPPRYLVGSPRRAAAIIVDNDRVRPPCLRLPGGLFNLCVPRGTNDCYRIDATRDFKEWTPLGVVPANEERVHFIDMDAPAFGERFYRIVPVPCE